MKTPTDTLSPSQVRGRVKAAIEAAKASMLAAMQRQHRVLLKSDRAETSGDSALW
jgi:hypothetical protein